MVSCWANKKYQVCHPVVDCDYWVASRVCLLPVCMPVYLALRLVKTTLLASRLFSCQATRGPIFEKIFEIGIGGTNVKVQVICWISQGRARQNKKLLHDATVCTEPAEHGRGGGVSMGVLGMGLTCRERRWTVVFFKRVFVVGFCRKIKTKPHVIITHTVACCQA